MQESANPVIGIVSAVDGKFVVQTGAAAGGHCGDARFGGIGGLDRFRPGGEVSNVGKAAGGKRNAFEILRSDNRLVHGARRIDGLGGNRTKAI